MSLFLQQKTLFLGVLGQRISVKTCLTWCTAFAENMKIRSLIRSSAHSRSSSIFTIYFLDTSNDSTVSKTWTNEKTFRKSCLCRALIGCRSILRSSSFNFNFSKVWNLNLLNLDDGFPRAKGRGHFLWFLRSLSSVLEVFPLVFTTV